MTTFEGSWEFDPTLNTWQRRNTNAIGSDTLCVNYGTPASPGQSVSSQCPVDGDSVTIRYEVSLCEGRILESREQTVTIGNDSALPTLERCLAVSRVGQPLRIEVTASTLYSDGIPPELSFLKPTDGLAVKLTVLEVHKQAKQPWELTEDQALDLALAVKERGAKYFKKTDWSHAAKKYEACVKLLSNRTFQRNEDAGKLRIACLSNQAACALKLSQYDTVISACDQVLTLEPSNIKALFRRGQAHLSKRLYEQARADFEVALGLDPADTAVSTALAQTNKLLLDEKQQLQRRYKGMFNST